MSTTAIYVRVSTTTQDTRSQERDLKVWADSQEHPVHWYRDKATGTKMERPGLNRLLADLRSGQIHKLVIWRLDRLGRTAKGLLELIEELQRCRCTFVSLRDAIDLETASGRLLLVVLAGVAAFETEVRSERQLEGIATVREENGGKCPWGGRKAGQPNKSTQAKVATVQRLHREGTAIAEISRIVGLTRQTIYRILAVPCLDVAAE